MPPRIKTALKTKGVQLGASKVYLIKWQVSICMQKTFQLYGVNMKKFASSIVIELHILLYVSKEKEKWQKLFLLRKKCTF